MNWLSLQTAAQFSVEHIFNVLPEGLLIALFAWGLLRVLRGQNSGTRFAVWFGALLAIAALPVLGILGYGHSFFAVGMGSESARGSKHPAINLPARWALFIFLMWALGVCVAMTRLVSGLWRLGSMRRRCTAIDAADFDPALGKTLDAISAAGATVASSESARVPAAIGFWNRTILLPAWTLREMPAEDLNVILLHEFAHLRRGDDWTNLIQKFVRGLFFFHPAVWWIENRLSVEREMACDDAVLAETANPRGYASCLVSLLEKSLAHRPANGQLSMVQAAVHRAREASLRLARILDTKRPAATRVWKPALGMVAVFFVGCLAVLPHAPQFVAVDRGANDRGVKDRSVNQAGVSAGTVDHAYAAAVTGPSLPAAAVIPASLRTDSLASAAPRATTPKFVHAPLRTKNAGGTSMTAPQAIAARLNSNDAIADEGLAAIRAVAAQEKAPEFRTLVFIETSQYTTADATVWSVQVWQLTVPSAVAAQWVRVPAVNKI
jgi:beta-lactamase regulating signal transducer with metallopeptidase domain